MNSQPIRWPQTSPLILVGGCDIPEWRERYVHLGGWRGFTFSVEHQRGIWTFRTSLRHVALKVRVG